MANDAGWLTGQQVNNFVIWLEFIETFPNYKRAFLLFVLRVENFSSIITKRDTKLWPDKWPKLCDSIQILNLCHRVLWTQRALTSCSGYIHEAQFISGYCAVLLLAAFKISRFMARAANNLRVREVPNGLGHWFLPLAAINCVVNALLIHH